MDMLIRLLPADNSISYWFMLIIKCLLSYLVLLILYRRHLHPLHAYPGPYLWTITRLPCSYYLAKGQLPFKLSELHDIYGPIVRIAPDELTYIQEGAWQDIYGKPQPRNTQLRKDPSQYIAAPGEKVGLEGSILNDEVHGRLRRNFAPGFSNQSLKEQEPYIQTYVDLLIQRLCENAQKGPVNVKKWIDFFTFDLIGELAFGESFDSLQKEEWATWPKLMRHVTTSISIFKMIKKTFWFLDVVILSLGPQNAKEDELAHRQYSEQKLLRRLAVKEPRSDFMWYAQRNLNKPDGMSFNEMRDIATFFIIAGSETTSSLLAGVVYYLLMDPASLSRLADEIREEFKSEEEITMTSVNGLAYLSAVISEGLRIYPPLPGSSWRLTPSSGCMIANRWIPGNMTVGLNQWAAYHSEYNFTRPYEFIPERWLSEDLKAQTHTQDGATKIGFEENEFKGDRRRAFQPFSVGPRNCVGRALANVEARLVLARLIWRFNMGIEEESRNWMEGQRCWLLWGEARPLMVSLKAVKR